MKDFCTRLPYGVKYNFGGYDGCDYTMNRIDCNTVDCAFQIEDVKPYLFPLSSMTEEQKKEYNKWKHEIPVCHYEYGDVVEEIELYDSPESFEYLIANHFDYRGLIPAGLAIDATGLNIY